MPRQTARFRALPIALAAVLAAMLCLAAGPSVAAEAPKGAAVTAQKAHPAPAPVAAPAAPSPPPAADAAAPDEPDDQTRSERRRSHVQFDDFDFKQAMDVAPWIVGVVFLVLGSIFLTPIILLVGIIWYKLRKTRLQNDAVLKLAERGVMPSAQAVDAVMAGTPPAQAAPAAIGTAVPQAVALRRHAVWSDLRKGVLLVAIGLALSLYSITDSAEPNWVGLVLLFVGAGYVALWWLEDRHLERRVIGGSGGDGKG